LLEEGCLGGVSGELEGALVGSTGLVEVTECSEELGAGAVVEVVAAERIAEGVELVEGGLGAGGVAQREWRGAGG
jgi:hypothetical protein